MKVLSVASEIYPLIKTGGLADVVGALPAALAAHDIEVTTLLPAYASITRGLKTKGKILHTYDDLLGHRAHLLGHTIGDLQVILLDAPRLFDREVGPYADQNGVDFADNWLRFAALGRAAADLAAGICKSYQPDLVHAHDWQAAMAPVYMHHGYMHHGYMRHAKPPSHIPSILTIHNMAFQGRFGPEVFKGLGLPDTAFGIDGLEFYGDVSYLKGALVCADAITTVSPTYAEEIRSPAFGMGLEGMIEARRAVVSGIVNGIDTSIWDPETDTALAENFSVTSLSKRRANRSAVEKAFGINKSTGPLFCVISRLTWQKGIDVLIDLFDALVDMGGRLVILGAGDQALESAVVAGAARHKGKIGVKIGYDETLSHLMQGGTDAILIPSRFEPCGLTQLYGLRYGCIPIVARTGGLADTIIDANEAGLNAEVATGFQFDGVTHDQLWRALKRACDLYAEPKDWTKMQKRAMKADFSWARSGKRYADLYRKLLKSE